MFSLRAVMAGVYLFGVQGTGGSVIMPNPHIFSSGQRPLNRLNENIVAAMAAKALEGLGAGITVDGNNLLFEGAGLGLAADVIGFQVKEYNKETGLMTGHFLKRDATGGMADGEKGFMIRGGTIVADALAGTQTTNSDLVVGILNGKNFAVRVKDINGNVSDIMPTVVTEITLSKLGAIQTSATPIKRAVESAAKSTSEWVAGALDLFLPSEFKTAVLNSLDSLRGSERREALKTGLSDELSTLKGELGITVKSLETLKAGAEKLSGAVDKLKTDLKTAGLLDDGMANALDALASPHAVKALEGMSASVAKRLAMAEQSLARGDVGEAKALLGQARAQAKSLQTAIVGNQARETAKLTAVFKLIRQMAVTDPRQVPGARIKALETIKGLFQQKLIPASVFTPLWSGLTKDLDEQATKLASAQFGENVQNVKVMMSAFGHDFKKIGEGAALGDFVKNPNWLTTSGQILASFTPAWMVANGRDLAANVQKMWDTNGKEGKLASALTTLAFVPAVGGVIKASFREYQALRLTAEVIETSEPLIKNLDEAATIANSLEKTAAKIADISPELLKSLPEDRVFARAMNQEYVMDFLKGEGKLGGKNAFVTAAEDLKDANTPSKIAKAVEIQKETGVYATNIDTVIVFESATPGKVPHGIRFASEGDGAGYAFYKEGLKTGNAGSARQWIVPNEKVHALEEKGFRIKEIYQVTENGEKIKWNLAANPDGTYSVISKERFLNVNNKLENTTSLKTTSNGLPESLSKKPSTVAPSAANSGKGLGFKGETPTLPFTGKSAFQTPNANSPTPSSTNSVGETNEKDNTAVPVGINGKSANTQTLAPMNKATDGNQTLDIKAVLAQDAALSQRLAASESALTEAKEKGILPSNDLTALGSLLNDAKQSLATMRDGAKAGDTETTMSASQQARVALARVENKSEEISIRLKGATTESEQALLAATVKADQILEEAYLVAGIPGAENRVLSELQMSHAQGIRQEADLSLRAGSAAQMAAATKSNLVLSLKIVETKERLVEKWTKEIESYKAGHGTDAGLAAKASKIVQFLTKVHTFQLTSAAKDLLPALGGMVKSFGAEVAKERIKFEGMKVSLEEATAHFDAAIVAGKQMKVLEAKPQWTKEDAALHEQLGAKVKVETAAGHLTILETRLKVKTDDFTELSETLKLSPTEMVRLKNNIEDLGARVGKLKQEAVALSSDIKLDGNKAQKIDVKWAALNTRVETAEAALALGQTVRDVEDATSLLGSLGKGAYTHLTVVGHYDMVAAKSILKNSLVDSFGSGDADDMRRLQGNLIVEGKAGQVFGVVVELLAAKGLGYVLKETGMATRAAAMASKMDQFLARAVNRVITGYVAMGKGTEILKVARNGALIGGVLEVGFAQAKAWTVGEDVVKGTDLYGNALMEKKHGWIGWSDAGQKFLEGSLAGAGFTKYGPLGKLFGDGARGVGWAAERGASGMSAGLVKDSATLLAKGVRHAEAIGIGMVADQGTIAVTESALTGLGVNGRDAKNWSRFAGGLVGGTASGMTRGYAGKNGEQLIDLSEGRSEKGTSYNFEISTKEDLTKLTQAKARYGETWAKQGVEPKVTMTEELRASMKPSEFKKFSQGMEVSVVKDTGERLQIKSAKLDKTAEGLENKVKLDEKTIGDLKTVDSGLAKQEVNSKEQLIEKKNELAEIQKSEKPRGEPNGSAEQTIWEKGIAKAKGIGDDILAFFRGDRPEVDGGTKERGTVPSTGKDVHAPREGIEGVGPEQRGAPKEPFDFGGRVEKSIAASAETRRASAETRREIDRLEGEISSIKERRSGIRGEIKVLEAGVRDNNRRASIARREQQAVNTQYDILQKIAARGEKTAGLSVDVKAAEPAKSPTKWTSKLKQGYEMIQTRLFGNGRMVESDGVKMFVVHVPENGSVDAAYALGREKGAAWTVAIQEGKKYSGKDKITVYDHAAAGKQSGPMSFGQLLGKGGQTTGMSNVGEFATIKAAYEAMQLKEDVTATGAGRTLSLKQLKGAAESVKPGVVGKLAAGASDKLKEAVTDDYKDLTRNALKSMFIGKEDKKQDQSTTGTVTTTQPRAPPPEFGKNNKTDGLGFRNNHVLKTNEVILDYGPPRPPTSPADSPSSPQSLLPPNLKPGKSESFAVHDPAPLSPAQSQTLNARPRAPSEPPAKAVGSPHVAMVVPEIVREIPRSEAPSLEGLLQRTNQTSDLAPDLTRSGYILKQTAAIEGYGFESLKGLSDADLSKKAGQYVDEVLKDPNARISVVRLTGQTEEVYQVRAPDGRTVYFTKDGSIVDMSLTQEGDALTSPAAPKAKETLTTNAPVAIPPAAPQGSPSVTRREPVREFGDVFN